MTDIRTGLVWALAYFDARQTLGIDDAVGRADEEVNVIAGVRAKKNVAPRPETPAEIESCLGLDQEPEKAVTVIGRDTDTDTGISIIDLAGMFPAVGETRIALSASLEDGKHPGECGESFIIACGSPEKRGRELRKLAQTLIDVAGRIEGK